MEEELITSKLPIHMWQSCLDASNTRRWLVAPPVSLEWVSFFCILCPMTRGMRLDFKFGGGEKHVVFALENSSNALEQFSPDVLQSKERHELISRIRPSDNRGGRNALANLTYTELVKCAMRADRPIMFDAFENYLHTGSPSKQVAWTAVENTRTSVLQRWKSCARRLASLFLGRWAFRQWP